MQERQLAPVSLSLPNLHLWAPHHPTRCVGPKVYAPAMLDFQDRAEATILRLLHL